MAELNTKAPDAYADDGAVCVLVAGNTSPDYTHLAVDLIVPRTAGNNPIIPQDSHD